MPAPPAKKSKEPSTISMVVEKWKEGQFEQCSPVHRINGFPWRLRLCNGEFQRKLDLICDKSTESELWWCTAAIKTSFGESIERVNFNSWQRDTQTLRFCHGKFCVGLLLEVKITPNLDGSRMRTRPILNPFKQRNGILVIEGEKIHVDKESLASQSSYFDRLFNGNFKEKKMKEIPLEDVNHEEFSNILKLVYRLDGASLTDENVHRVMELVDRFDLKIVEDRVVSYLLSNFSLISIHDKLLISELYNIPLLKEKMISKYTIQILGKLSQSPVWDQLSKETTKAIVKHCCYDNYFSSSSSDSDSDRRSVIAYSPV